MLRYTLLAAALALSLAAQTFADDKDGFADTFNIKPADFVSSGKNDYFILEPGYQLIMEGKDEGKPARLVTTVLDETKTVDGVETRVVEEHESLGGKIIEVSRNYFAIDKNTNDVYYFGEDVDNYKDGKVSNHGGTWLSGANGARYGLAMPAKPTVGQKYYQEIAPKEAMDRAEVKSVTEKVKVPAGAFENCLKTEETTPLEPGERETKLYAPGVGQLRDGPMRLVKYGRGIEGRADRGAAEAAEAMLAADAARKAAAEAPVPRPSTTRR